MKITYTELKKIDANDRKRRRLKRDNARLRAVIAALIAGDEAMKAKAQALFDKSEVTETKMRAGLPPT